MQSFLPTISEAREILGDPAYNFRWTVVLPTDVYQPVYSSYGATDTGASYSSTGFLNIPVVPFGRVESVNLPGISIDPDGRFGAGAKQHYARWIDVGSCEMTMYEDMNYNSLMYLKSWQSMVVDQYHNYYPSYYYKRDVYFYAFDPVSSDAPVMITTLKNSWVPAVGVGLSYEYSSAGMVTIPTPLQLDDVTYSFNRHRKTIGIGTNF